METDRSYAVAVHSNLTLMSYVNLFTLRVRSSFRHGSTVLGGAIFLTYNYSEVFEYPGPAESSIMVNAWL